jgi:hypothetical protein
VRGEVAELARKSILLVGALSSGLTARVDAIYTAGACRWERD